MRHPLTLAPALLITLSLSTAAQASSQLAVEKGCYSCHGAQRRGEAPSIERLAAKLARLKDDAAAEQKFVAKYRAGEAFERVDAHERLSVESASLLIHWLVTGAK
jgi:cytochrome c551/c552